MDKAGLALAVDSAITRESIPEVLVRARELAATGGPPPAVRSAVLEQAARELRKLIIAECLAAGAPDVDGTALSGVVTGHAKSCVTGRQTGTACIYALLRDTDNDPLPTRAVEVQVEGSKPSTAQLGCTQCRRPLELDIQFADPGSPAEDLGFDSSAERHAFCSVLCDGSKLCFFQALLLGQSLVSSGSTKDRVLMHSPKVPDLFLKVLAQSWELRPMKLLPKVASQAAAWTGKLSHLHGLELTEYSKVIVLELGLVVQSNIDALFDLECPAAVFLKQTDTTAGTTCSAREVDAMAVPGALPVTSRSLDLSMVLLQPSTKAFQRMVAEVGSKSVAWPPRGGEGSGGQSGIEDYVMRFYTTFLSGSWREIPSDFVPVSLVDRGKALPKGLCYNVQIRQLWESLEQILREGGQDRPEASCSVAGLLASVFSVANERCAADVCSGGVPEAARRVEAHRCRACGGYDALGTRDPIDQRWRCRFCWESLLLDALLRDGCAMPLPPVQAEALRNELGACYAGPGRQRWGWASGNQAGWIEFRPGGVLWTKDEGVGAWDAWGDDSRMRLSIHLSKREYNEVRHVMQLRQGGEQMELEELYREVVKPLGFSRASIERKVRCWLLGPPRRTATPAAVTAAPVKEEEDQVAGSPAPEQSAEAQEPVGKPAEGPVVAEQPSCDAALAAGTPPAEDCGGDAAAPVSAPARSKLAYLL